MPEKPSVLLEKEQEQVKSPEYSKEEQTYLSALKKKMKQAKDERDKEHDELDGMDYKTYYELNEKLANTFTSPKRNKEDTNFQSGIVRQKLFALLSGIANLNLSGDISAFDQEGLRIQAIGNAMEDVVLKTNELDNDDEKKLLRQYELLKQGTVFVEEMWDERQQTQKTMKGKFDGKLNAKWEKKLKKAFAKPTRNIVCGLNVYLGDMTKYDISEQPFIFTIDVLPYEEAKTIFGKWDRWGFVPRKTTQFVNDQGDTILDTQLDNVEIVRYQDKWNNEFALLLNGVLMTPMGLPLPWGYEEYNLAQQNLEPIHAKFAYGKSLVARVRNKVALLDEMLRLEVLKTQKSLMPPKFNLTGRIVSNRVFMPGKINHGIDPRQILNADDKEVQGVTTAEFAMIKELQESINNETVSPVFQGQKATGDPTATEIIELQRQAKMVLGLTILAASLLEWKLEWLRLKNLLAHWFEPEDEVLDEARGELKAKYRQVGVDRPIEGEGMGRRIIIPTKQIPSGEAIYKAEQGLSQEQGIPVRLIFVNPDEIQSAKLIWQIVVKPKEKTTSEVQKLMFRAFMQDAVAFGPLLNLQTLAEEFANTWQKDPKKIFNSPEQMQMNQMQQAQTESKTVSPRVNLPQPEGLMNREISQEMKMA